MSFFRHLTRATHLPKHLCRKPSFTSHVDFIRLLSRSTNHSDSRHSTTTTPAPPSPSSSSPPKLTLHYPQPPTTAHSDLESYLAYAARTGLSAKSTTYVGTRYEYTVAAALRRLGFSLRRIGGRDDGGIDLLGTWTVPAASTASPEELSGPPPHLATPAAAVVQDGEIREDAGSSSGNTKTAAACITLRIILQCKAYTTKAGPQHVRELEGAFVAAPPGWRSNNIHDTTTRSSTSSSSSTSNGSGGVVGILVAQNPATKGVRDSLGRSRWPMAFISCSKDGRVEQMLWNRRAEEQGLEGVGVAVQHKGVEVDGASTEELVLTWQGLPYLADNVEDVRNEDL